MLMTNNICAQNAGVIGGMVYNSESQQPLIGASVYLSQTTLGDATNKDGYFEITNVPEGSYRLVISYLGFTTSHQEVKIAGSESIFIEEVLSPAKKQLEDLEVKAYRDRIWERNVARFERAFIGNTQNAEHTKIVNPEVLNFSVNAGILTAQSSERLQIVNNATGYNITIDLVSFEWDYLNDRGSTTYFSKFLEQEPRSEQEMKK
jgi:hypothetical protein